MKNTRISNNVVAELHTQSQEIVLRIDSGGFYVLTIRREGEQVGKDVRKDKRFGVVAQEFLVRSNLDNAHLDYLQTAKIYDGLSKRDNA
jgi:hypothetical protein